MTEFLEKKLEAIFDGLDNDIITISDAIFLRAFIKAQAEVVEALREKANLSGRIENLETEIARIELAIKAEVEK